MSAKRRFGIRGWQKLEGFYPPRIKPDEMLRHYAEVASVVEADNTFSGIPKPERLAEWVAQTPQDFRFDLIAFGGLTLHQRRPGDSGPVTRQSWTEVAVEPPEVLFEDFAASVAPLAEAGRLGCVILQFPPWFEASEVSRAYLARVRERLDDLPLAKGRYLFSASSHSWDHTVNYHRADNQYPFEMADQGDFEGSYYMATRWTGGSA